MRRTILLGGVLPFVAAFLGGLLAVGVAVPRAADAQDARIRAEQFTIVDGSGADRIRLSNGPGIAAAVGVLAPDGVTSRVKKWSSQIISRPSGSAMLSPAASSGRVRARLLRWRRIMRL